MEFAEAVMRVNESDTCSVPMAARTDSECRFRFEYLSG